MGRTGRGDGRRIGGRLEWVGVGEERGKKDIVAMVGCYIFGGVGDEEKRLVWGFAVGTQAVLGNSAGQYFLQAWRITSTVSCVEI